MTVITARHGAAILPLTLATLFLLCMVVAVFSPGGKNVPFLDEYDQRGVPDVRSSIAPGVVFSVLGETGYFAALASLASLIIVLVLRRHRVSLILFFVTLFTIAECTRLWLPFREFPDYETIYHELSRGHAPDVERYAFFLRLEFVSWSCCAVPGFVGSLISLLWLLIHVRHKRSRYEEATGKLTVMPENGQPMEDSISEDPK